jgi:regulator of replication initiation timing
MLLLSIAIAALGIGLISLALIVALKNKQSAELNAVSQQLKDTSEQTHILRSEVSELRTGLLSIGKRVLEVDQQNQELMQQQAAQKYDDPDAKIYSRAVKMVELGADLDEVIRECELPRAEAELLFSLHKQKDA